MKTYRELYPMGRKFCSICKHWRPVSDFKVRKWVDEPECTIAGMLASECSRCNTVAWRISHGCQPRIFYPHGNPGSEKYKEHRKVRHRIAQQKLREDPAYQERQKEYKKIWRNAKTGAIARSKPLKNIDPQVDPTPLGEWLGSLDITQRELSYRSELSEKFFSSPRRSILISQVDHICTKLGYPEMVSILYEAA